MVTDEIEAKTRMLHPTSIYDAMTGRDQEPLKPAVIVTAEDLTRARQLETRERPLNADFVAAVQEKGVVLYDPLGHAVGRTNCVATAAEYLLTYDKRHHELSHN